MVSDDITMTRHLTFSYFSLVVGMIISPVLLAILTRILSVEEYGVYTLLATTAVLAGVILDLGISQFIITKLPGMRKKDKLTYSSSLLLFHFLIVAVLLAIAFIPHVHEAGINLLGLQGYRAAFDTMLFVAALSILFRVVNSLLVGNKRMEFKAITDILPNVILTLSLITVFIAFKRFTVQTTMIIWLAGFIITIILSMLFLLARKEFALRLVRFSQVKTGFIFAIPLVPAIIGPWTVRVVDRYFLNSYHGSESVAIYGLAYALVTLVSTFGSAVTTTLYPHIAERWNLKKDHNMLFSSALKYGLVIIAPCIIGILALGKQIITMMSGVKYAQSATLLPIIVWYPLFFFLIYLFRQQLLLRDKTGKLGAILFSGAVFNIILNLVLIPKWGIYGAGTANILSYVYMFLFTFFFAKKYMVWNWRYVKPARIALASVIMGVAVFLLNPSTFIFKLVTMAFGAAFYGALLIVFKVFDRMEQDIIRRYLLSTPARPLVEWVWRK
ncbi:MAG: polysaccharide biosynthesis C-terminal domain-containing protein [Nanoarchaeota archaeon]|nr:polysaccharide biosynthesis C-terminal domain-containing protein [Nanoarchaeota archaeon]